MVTLSRTAEIRATAQHDVPRAEAMLAALIADLFAIPVADLRINHDQYSLNSLNGFFTSDGADFFFKFHQEEGEELTAQNRVQVHARADAHHKGADGQHLGDAKAHKDGQDDDADGDDCARAEQGGEDRRGYDGEQHADDDGLIAAQLNGLADQSVRDAGFQQIGQTMRRTRR